MRFINLLLISFTLVRAQFFRTIWETMEFPADSEITFGYGYKHCAAGDVNADGYDDFGISAPLAFTGPDRQTGRLNIYFGGPELEMTPAATRTSRAAGTWT